MPRQTRPVTKMAARRLDLDLSARPIADACGVTNPLIAFIEKHQRPCVKQRTRTTIATVLGMRVEELFDAEGWAIPLPGETPTKVLPTRLPKDQVKRILTMTKQGFIRRDIARKEDVSSYAVWRTQAQEAERRGIPLRRYLAEVDDRGRGAKT